ncbi:amino acid ABC transporter permease [Polynucleobacter sp. MWH-Loch1C5]|uniref:amino acid ABC transporter permease n=1 Tax=Polynucleobacter sp. MWH-Loch1C5 TaxID=2689108 RepID=UPI001C0C531B|nr:amino acid ABC transporter permease [Polynucleobacter sp. MWH-Loch1C5]MBU3542346.1 amino acid ABC transporter permease [Polynucleobacter sp. MWH-Loch1C5]
MTWDWQVFCKSTIEEDYSPVCFGTGGEITYLDWLLSAWGWTLAVSATGLIIALFFGVTIGTLRTLNHSSLVNKILRAFATAWVELFRNIPVLVQVFIWYHVLHALFPILKGFPSFILVSFALGFFTSARIAEQVRAGIESLPKGQRHAATAMGMTQIQSYRFVLLPMALRIVIPPLTSESMNIVKNSSVAFAVSVADLTLFALQAQEETSRGIEIYLGVTLLYAISAFTVNRVMSLIEKRTRVPGFIGPTVQGGH